MMAYLGNINANNDLRGILLYPLPFDSEPIDETYDVKIASDGPDVKIQFLTIDLSQDWKKIAFDLLSIIDINLANKKAQEIAS